MKYHSSRLHYWLLHTSIVDTDKLAPYTRQASPHPCRAQAVCLVYASNMHITILHALHLSGPLALSNLVPRPPPRLYLAAVEKSQTFLHSCEIKSGLGTRLALSSTP